MKPLFLLSLLAAVLAAAEWGPEVRLTENMHSDFNFWSCQRRVAAAPDGRIHAVWYVMNSGLGTYKFQIYYKRYNPGTGWSADTMISADLYAESTYCKYPSLAIDSSGRVYAVWGNGAADAGDELVYVKTCLPSGTGNGGWDEMSRLLSTSGTGYTRECPNVAATPDGHVHATWLEIASGGTYYVAYRERIDTTWQTQVNLDASTNYKVYPSVAGSRDNRVHIAWHGRSGPSGFYNVFYKARTDTVWGPTENVSNGVRHQMYPCICVNPATNEPHVLWQGQDASSNNRVVHSWRTAAGWQPRDTVSEPGSTYSQGTGQIAFTPDGIGYALWAGRSGASPTVDQVRWSERSLAGAWSAAANLTDTTNSRERPSVAGSGGADSGNLSVVWSDYRDGNSEIYYCHGRSTGSFINEQPAAPQLARRPATVIRGSVELSREGAGTLLDPCGRVTAHLWPGSNDIRGLAPGVYFLTGDGPAPRQIVVVR